MRWRGGRQSENVEDARGVSGKAVAGGGAGLMIIAIIIALLGGDPRQFLQQANKFRSSTGNVKSHLKPPVL